MCAGLQRQQMMEANPNSALVYFKSRVASSKQFFIFVHAFLISVPQAPPRVSAKNNLSVSHIAVRSSEWKWLKKWLGNKQHAKWNSENIWEILLLTALSPSFPLSSITIITILKITKRLNIIHWALKMHKTALSSSDASFKLIIMLIQ